MRKFSGLFEMSSKFPQRDSRACDDDGSNAVSAALSKYEAAIKSGIRKNQRREGVVVLDEGGHISVCEAHQSDNHLRYVEQGQDSVGKPRGPVSRDLFRWPLSGWAN